MKMVKKRNCRNLNFRLPNFMKPTFYNRCRRKKQEPCVKNMGLNKKFICLASINNSPDSVQSFFNWSNTLQNRVAYIVCKRIRAEKWLKIYLEKFRLWFFGSKEELFGYIAGSSHQKRRRTAKIQKSSKHKKMWTVLFIEPILKIYGKI